jgi:hypothetical protein
MLIATLQQADERPSADFSTRLAAFALFFDVAALAALRIPFRSSSSSRWAYQMAIVPIAANPAIASR